MSNSDTKLTLISCDGEKFEIERKVAMSSQQLANMIEDDCAGIIPVPNVTASILAKVLEYCEKHVDKSSTDKEATDEPVADESSVDKEEAIEPVVADDPLETWDNEFVKVDSDTLYDLLLAANYLNVEGLLNLLVQTIADMIKGKTTEELRKTFNIVNDFTPEEEEEIRKENKWAFE